MSCWRHRETLLFIYNGDLRSSNWRDGCPILLLTFNSKGELFVCVKNLFLFSDVSAPKVDSCPRMHPSIPDVLLRDQTPWCFWLSWWTSCQISRRQCYKHLPGLCEETGKTKSLTSTNHRSGPGVSSRRRVKKLSIMTTDGTSRNVL